MVGVDHPGPENAEQDDEDGELVDGPEHVAGHVAHPLFNVDQVVLGFPLEGVDVINKFQLSINVWVGSVVKCLGL